VAILPGHVDAQQQQTARITGRVVDAQSQAPLTDVQVYLVGANLGAISRQTGQYLILNVPPGTYEMRAERIGLGTVSRQVTVTAGAALEENFELTSQALNLDAIVVTGTAGASRRREVGNSIAQINTAEVPIRPMTAGELLVSAAPGMEVTLGGETGMGTRIRLRGENSINNDNPPILYIDGIRMFSGGFDRTPSKDQGNRFANVNTTALDMINPNDIERVEVIKGSAATTLYGTEASGGVIQVFRSEARLAGRAGVDGGDAAGHAVEPALRRGRPRQRLQRHQRIPLHGSVELHRVPEVRRVHAGHRAHAGLLPERARRQSGAPVLQLG
jgi:hypothetical protein